MCVASALPVLLEPVWFCTSACVCMVGRLRKSQDRGCLSGGRGCARARMRRRERTPPEVREAREKERELKELDRDIRTVFAYNLPLKADERNLFEFFSKGGTVEDVRIIMDRNTRRSKGFAYIEYASRVRSYIRLTALTLPCVLHACVLARRHMLRLLHLGAG